MKRVSFEVTRWTWLLQPLATLIWRSCLLAGNRRAGAGLGWPWVESARIATDRTQPPCYSSATCGVRLELLYILCQLEGKLYVAGVYELYDVDSASVVPSRSLIVYRPYFLSQPLQRSTSPFVAETPTSCRICPLTSLAASMDKHHSDPGEVGEEKPFDFFGLPQELRDLIYQGLIADCRKCAAGSDKRQGQNLRVALRNGPRRNTLGVRRQFSDEHEHLTRKSSALVIRDNGLPLQPLKLGSYTTRVRNVDAELWIGSSPPMYSQAVAEEIDGLTHYMSTILSQVKQCREVDYRH